MGGRGRGYRGGRSGGSQFSGNIQKTAQDDVKALSSRMSNVSVAETGGAVGGRGALVGRGSSRGGPKFSGPRDKQFYDLVQTKPENLISKKGSKGNSIVLTTNFYGFKKRPDYRIFQYRVDVKDVEETHIKKFLLRQHKDKLPLHIFDGSTIFCVERLFAEKEKSKLTLSSQLKPSDKYGDKLIVDLEIRLVGEVHPTDHHYLQFYSIILRQFMEKLELQQFGRNFFDSKDVHEVSQFHLEIWPGYITSIRQHENDVLLCSEVANKIFRTDTLYDQLKSFKSSAGIDRFKSNFIGAIVMTRYNNKTYRIDDFSEKTPNSTFERGGELVSFVTYYRQKYNINIRDCSQQLVVSKPRDRDRRGGRNDFVLLVPELCYMTGLTDEQRANFTMMSALARFTRQGPTERMNTLTKFNKRLSSSKGVTDSLKSWGLEIKTQPETVHARVLPSAVMIMGNSKELQLKEDADWSRDFGRSFGMFSPMNITKLLVIMSNRDQRDAKNFIDGFHKVGPKLGIAIQGIQFEITNGFRSNDYIQALNRILPELNPNFVLLFLPNDNSECYSVVKKYLCFQHPIPSQIVTVSKVLRKYMKNGTPQLTFPTKVLAQMSAKIGGEPWVCKGMPPNIMVAGYDTYHDSERKGASIGALVGSYNGTLTKYYSTISIHTGREEICSQLVVMFGKLLRIYKNKNGAYPNRIIFYRDGVGEGQVSYVVDTEVSALKELFASISPDKLIKFAFIIVSKRVNTRFMRPVGGDRYDNPSPGTVVDDVVTLPERYDFFLVSQSVRQGTVNPTSYNVIFDQCGYSPDQLQSLSQKLTHLYFNWAGTVRVPAPCQYAHKLAYLVGNSLHRDVPELLADTLYYL